MQNNVALPPLSQVAVKTSGRPQCEEKSVNLAQLTIGTKVLLASGDRSEVVAINAEAESVLVRYLDALGEPELVGTEAWLSADEILAIDMGTHAEGRT
jgi:hypothetical protein